ncbi:IS30 family transposase [Sinorhizobium meliloti]|uniref:IS30 family transposase n=1 Tax=Rhizobium meliloti TaxID=382 RepID=UPI001EEE74B3|nr:IS30 family transposase [Sinorhizobium meliloti]
MERKVPVGEIARQLGRHRSTIYRELKRNTFHDAEFPEYSGYYSGIANDISKERRRRLQAQPPPAIARTGHRAAEGTLVAGADRRPSACRWCERRPRLHRDDLSLHLWQGRLCAGALSASAGRPSQAPPTRSRKPRDRSIPFDCRISQRPGIADHSEFGHWEGDLLIFERALGNANVTSLVERKSRYTVMIKNGSRHSRPLIDKIVDAFAPLPAFARQSFTFDRGTEFRGFKALEDGLGARSWFCDPNSPWQKGAVENTNKRIRRFVPSDTDLSAVSQPQLVALAHHLNSLPRKCLGYRTPAEVFMAHLRDCG